MLTARDPAAQVAKLLRCHANPTVAYHAAQSEYDKRQRHICRRGTNTAVELANLDHWAEVVRRLETLSRSEGW